MQAQSQLPCARANSDTQDSRTELWEETSTSTHLGAPRGRDQGFSSLHAAAPSTGSSCGKCPEAAG